MARTTRSDLQNLCTPEELGLLAAASAGSIDGLSVADLRRNVASARRFRDKWREVASRQLRAAKRRAPEVGERSPRSGEKAQLFSVALAVLESRLKAAFPSAGAARIGRQSGVAMGDKAQRDAAAHQDRASSRGRLSRVRSEFNAVEPAPAKKAARTEPAIARPRKRKPSAASAPAPTHPKVRMSAPGREQRSARSAAKRSGMRASGMLSRSRGHILARGGRAQAKRDSRA